MLCSCYSFLNVFALNLATNQTSLTTISVEIQWNIPYQNILLNPFWYLDFDCDFKETQIPFFYYLIMSNIWLLFIFDNFDMWDLSTRPFIFFPFFHEFSDIHLVPWYCLFFVVYPERECISLPTCHKHAFFSPFANILPQKNTVYDCGHFDGLLWENN